MNRVDTMSVAACVQAATDSYNCGNKSNAVQLLRSAVSRHRDDAHALQYLGVTFGQLCHDYENACECLLRSTQIFPHDHDAHNNLGVMLQRWGKYSESIKSYKNACSVKPNYAEAYCNLGSLLMKMSRYKEAIKYFKIAVDLKHQQAVGGYLALMYKYGQLEDAIDSYTRCIAIEPAKVSLKVDLFSLCIYKHGLYNLEPQLDILLRDEKIEDLCNLKSKIYLKVTKLILCWLKGDYKEFSALFGQVDDLINLCKEPIDDKTLAYYRYLKELSNLPTNFHSLNTSQLLDKIYFIGDSHILSAANLLVNITGTNKVTVSQLIKGCKAWHLANDEGNKFKYAFNQIVKNIPDKSIVFLSMGEIDCRPNEGVYLNYKKRGIEVKQNINFIVEGYINYVLKLLNQKNCDIYFVGVPACKESRLEQLNNTEKQEFVGLIQYFNYRLETQAQKGGAGFLDLYSKTAGENGVSNNKYHIENTHLIPLVYKTEIERLLNAS